MKKYIIKILIKLLGDNFSQLNQTDIPKLQEWLFDAYKNNGYAQYYTLRKKYISNLMSVGLSWEDYLICLGRIQELRSLNQNINQEVKRRENLKNKKVKKKS